MSGDQIIIQYKITVLAVQDFYGDTMCPNVMLLLQKQSSIIANR